ncbi:hypothetical protein [Mesorhizobium silamurunense]|uniref:hypothetical protein n=1 Tax=Mesorhizobium silamurunense TaxID=499528 RepID=UPI001FE65C22|nr:hypothetical protein [Mesorhizobium silamurunense]
MATRLELIEAIVERCRSSCRADKQRILDEFVAVTGYPRKHAIRVLRPRASGPSPARQYPVLYGAEVLEALVALWEASDRLCSKRLKPLIPILLPALERHGRLDLDGELRDKLLTISAATMDRLLSEVRAVARGGQRRRAGLSSAVRRSVPVRTFGDWNDPAPGYVEVDFVAHHRHLFVRQLCANDGLDRYRHRLDRVRAGADARKWSCHRCYQAGKVVVPLSASRRGL